MRAVTRKRLLALLESELLQLKLKVEANHWQPYNSAVARLDRLIQQLSKPKNLVDLQRMEREGKEAQRQRDIAWQAIQEQVEHLGTWMTEIVDLEFDIAELRKAFSNLPTRIEL